jgi:hypothetical protein
MALFRKPGKRAIVVSLQELLCAGEYVNYISMLVLKSYILTYLKFTRPSLLIITLPLLQWEIVLPGIF